MRTELEKQVLNFIKARDVPVTCVELSKEFGTGIHRMRNIRDDTVIAFGMSEKLMKALQGLCLRREVVPIPCDLDLYNNVSSKLLSEALVVQEGKKIRKVPFSPHGFVIFDDVVIWIHSIDQLLKLGLISKEEAEEAKAYDPKEFLEDGKFDKSASIKKVLALMDKTL